MATGYFTTLDLSPYLVDKDTGAPLSGGYVQFWEDADRTVPKLVFEKQNIGADPVTGQPIYQFVALPDPLIISGVGTLQNANGDNVAVYYYPFDADGNEQLYYVAVFNYLGVEQFTREGWGFGSSNGGGGGEGDEVIGDNMISNPQFAVVNFNPALGLTVSFTSSGTLNIPIAPGWNLQVVHTGNGSVVVARTAVAGSQNYATNPPYILSITPGLNIASLTLQQQLPNNPGIWSPQTAGVAGYIAANILLGPSTSATISYAPSVGAPIQLLADNNISTTYVEYSNTVQLPPSANTSNADTGFVNINIALSTTVASLISSIQIVGLDTNLTGIFFSQDTVNRQVDHLFNYYKPRLEFKPIPSWLVGWNFVLNPAQLGSSIAAQATGANSSYYGPAIVTAAAGGWDQTIFFQTANSGLTISRDTTGALKVLAAAVGQHALVQYIPAPEAIEMLSRRKCVMVSANASEAKTVTVSLWYMKGSLPSTIGSNQSIVATLDANGYPATQNGTWVPVPRQGLGTGAGGNGAQFTVPVAPSGAADFNHIPLSGWDMQGVVDINGATFFAIVVGTASLAINDYLLYQDISCQDGDIPTVTAAQDMGEAIARCQRYFCSSFRPGVAPATQTGQTYVVSCFAISFGGSTGNYGQEMIDFPVQMYQIPVTIIYNPVNNNNFAYSQVTASDCMTQLDTFITENAFLFQTHQSGTTQGSCIFNWSADARLGQ